jgi:acetyl-CoA synthase
MERAEKLIQRCIEVRGVKIKMNKVPIPVAFGSAFEGERVRKDVLRMEFGGKRARAFEYLRMKPADEVEDGKVTIVGSDLDTCEAGGAMSLGILVDVAGR